MDLDQYRWTPSDVGTSLPRPKPTKHDIPRHHRGERFIRGPIPLEWLRACLPLGLKSLNVAMALWWLAGMKRTNPVRLTKQALAEFDVTAETGRVILSKMERMGLIRVHRHRGRGPDVVLLPIGENRIHHVAADERSAQASTKTSINGRPP